MDLAGSERQKLTATTGIRLKEAGSINKSLLGRLSNNMLCASMYNCEALGNVINALVDISNGKPRYVHYRDSKLTFLLKDSLGGSAVTSLVANISPSASSYAETLSTLRFANRAKMIKNQAWLNLIIDANEILDNG